MTDTDIVDSDDRSDYSDAERNAGTLFGQADILKYGTAEGEEPLIDTLASFARTALDDPGALDLPYYDGVNDYDPTFARDYAISRLDDIIETLNPSTETTGTLARSVRVLGRQLAERADRLREVDAEDGSDEDRRYNEAAKQLDAALDLIDQALEVLGAEGMAS